MEAPDIRRLSYIFPLPLALRPGLCESRTMKRLAVLLALLPSVAPADGPITPEEFERLVTGKTFSYASGGIAYGAEDYLDNRRVRWSFLDGDCTEGEWYVSGDQICFVYDDIPSPQCWTFYLRGGRLTAQFQSDPAATELYETAREDEPLYCKGPKIGV